MAKLYREHVLKEPPAPANLVRLDEIQPAVATPPVEEREEVGSFGD
jgi:hypothetical protein